MAFWNLLFLLKPPRAFRLSRGKEDGALPKLPVFQKFLSLLRKLPPKGCWRWPLLKIAKSAPYVSNTLRLLSLPDALKDAIASGATTEGHARALASLEDPHLIIEAYKIILSDNLSVRGAEELARKMKARENIAPKQQSPAQRLQNEEL